MAVHKIDVSLAVYGDLLRIAESCVEGRNAVAIILGRYVTAGDGIDNPVAHDANLITTGIRNEHVAVWVHGNAGRRAELRSGGAATIPAGPPISTAGDRDDIAAGRESAHTPVA